MSFVHTKYHIYVPCFIKGGNIKEEDLTGHFKTFRKGKEFKKNGRLLVFQYYHK